MQTIHEQKPVVLVVDDIPDNIHTLSGILSGLPHEHFLNKKGSS